MTTLEVEFNGTTTVIETDSAATFAGIYDVWKYFFSGNIRISADDVYFDDIWDDFRLRLMKDTLSKLYTYRNFTEWGLDQTWREYVRLRRPIRPDIEGNINSYLYSMLILKPNNEYIIVFFDSSEYVRGVITAMNWFGVNPNDYIKYIVRDFDGRLEQIVYQ